MPCGLGMKCLILQHMNIALSGYLLKAEIRRCNEMMDMVNHFCSSVCHSVRTKRWRAYKNKYFMCTIELLFNIFCNSSCPMYIFVVKTI